MVVPDGGAARGGRHPAGHLLGHRRGAPAAVRRVAGRSRLGMGPGAGPGHRGRGVRRPARPVRDVRPGRRRRRRSGRARRPSAAGMGQRRMVGRRRSAGPVGGAGAGLAGLQQAALGALADRPMAVPTARSESAAELLCAEMTADGLPMDRARRRAIIAGFVGPRPRSEAEATAAAGRPRRRGARATSPAGRRGRPAQPPPRSRSLLGRLGIEVADTRAWRLRELPRPSHPVVRPCSPGARRSGSPPPTATRWLDEHLGADGRLRGEWTGSDGAAGRMTASAGLHNMPAELRPAVMAETGTSSSAPTWARSSPGCWPRFPATRPWPRRPRADDMYAPVAAQLGVDRATAKVAVLGAMYGADHRPRRPGAAPPRTPPTPWRWRTWTRPTAPAQAGRGPAHLRRAAGPDGVRRGSRPGPAEAPGRPRPGAATAETR